MNLSEVHDDLFRILKAFDKLCAEYTIEYTLHGGTLLGAVRYNDFIPWDDDLDVALTRNNFAKLKEALLHNCHFEVKYKDTWTARLCYEHDDQHAIDLFIYDYISDKFLGEKIKINLLRFCQGTFHERIDFAHYAPKYWVVLFITCAIGRIVSYRKKLMIYEYICEHFSGKKKKIHRSNDSFIGVGLVFKKEVMENYSRIQIRDDFFMCSKEYKEILIASYGPDYLIPPPESERKPQHKKI